jgi:hypothetical protein
VVRLYPTKAIRVMAPGTEAAPYTMTDANPRCTDLRLEDSDTPPSNRVVLWCGPSGNAMATQTWTADGVATEWVTDIPAAAAPPLVYVNDGMSEILATVGAGGMFEFNVAQSKLTVGTHGTPANGTILRLGPTDTFASFEGYLAKFPFKVVAASGEEPVLTETRHDATITEYARGVESAASILAEVNQSPDTLEADSLDHGWRPVQAVTVDLTTPPIDSVFSIGTVKITLDTDEFWRYTFSSTESEVVVASKLDLWRQTISSIASGGGASVQSSSGGGGSVTTGVLALIAWVGGLSHTPTTLSHTVWRRLTNSITIPALPFDWSAKFRLEMYSRNAGITFRVRLRNVTDDIQVAVSSFATPGNDPDDPLVTPLVAAMAANKEHVLELIGEDSGDNGEDAYVLATVSNL